MVLGEPVGDHEVDRASVGVAASCGSIERAALGAAGVAMPGAVLEVDAARWVVVASAVGVGVGEAADGRFGTRPAGQLDPERVVVAADVGAVPRSARTVRAANQPPTGPCRKPIPLRHTLLGMVQREFRAGGKAGAPAVRGSALVFARCATGATTHA